MADAEPSMQVPDDGVDVCNLADFLSAQDPENVVLVCTDPGGGAMHGIFAASGAVNAVKLLEHYDLLAYDGLLPPELFEMLYQKAEAQALAMRQQEADDTYARHVV
jgi:hypothetical protein